MVKIEGRGGSADELVTEYGYDQLGRRTRHWNNQLGSSNVERTDYDMQGRVTQTIAFGGDTTATTYSWVANLATSGMATYGGWTQTTTFANAKTLIEQKDLFGRAVAKTDLGGNAYAFSYDKGARLLTQAVGGETTSYSWYNTGRLSQVSTGTGNNSSYAYDANGNKLSEVTSRNSSTVQNATASYDAMNRRTSWSDTGGTNVPAASMEWKYDLNSNIRYTKYNYVTLDANGAEATQFTNQEYWYRYDLMDRVVVDKGVLNGSNVITHANGQGTTYEYYDDGQRKSATVITTQTYKEDWWYIGANPVEIYVPNGEPPYGATRGTREGGFVGLRTEIFAYRADGQLDTVSIAEGAFNWTNGYLGYVGEARLRGDFTYDKLGRLTRQVDWVYASDGTASEGYDRAVTYNAKGQVTDETVYSKRLSNNQLERQIVSTQYGTGTGYALGAATQVTIDAARLVSGSWDDGAVPDSVTTNTFYWRDGAVAYQTIYDPDNSTNNSVSTYNYSASGQLTSVGVTAERNRTIAFTNDMAGQVIRRDESDNSSTTVGDPHEVFYRFDGAEMGYTGNNGTLETDYFKSIEYRRKDEPGTRTTGAFRWGEGGGATHVEFDPSLKKINSYEQGGGAGSYTARAGDTLQSIARNAWGDASLWYKIAEANGMAGMGPAAALAEGQRLSLPSGVMSSSHNADTFRTYDPIKALGDTSPTTPKPSKTSNKCGVVGQILLVAIAVAVSIATSGALAGPLGSTIIAGAIGGAAGSVASQAVGVVTGIQDKFSWKGVGLAALSGGIGAGLGGVGALSRIAGSQVLGGAVRGALGSALTQGVAVATGLQSKFDFAGVAVGAVGGGVSTAIGGGVFGPVRGGSLAYYGSRAFSGMTAATAGAAVRSLLNGSSFGDNILAVLPEVIGSTIGNAVIDGIALRSAGGNGSSAPGPARTQAELRARAENLHFRSGRLIGNIQHNGSEPYPTVESGGPPQHVIVTGTRPPKPPSWLERRANELTGLMERAGNLLLDYNPMTLTHQAGGAISRLFGATESARAFDDGAAFSRGYWRSVAQAPAHALIYAGNLITRPGPTLRNTAAGILTTAHNVFMADVSDIRDGFRQMRNEIRTGGPAVAERYGESAGRLVVGAGSIVIPALRGSSVARFGSATERVAPAATPVSPAAVSTRPLAGQSADSILLGRGVTDAGLRQSILNTGFNPAILADASSATLGRFDKLFQGTLDAGKTFRGRLGNLSTRTRTIEQAVEIDRLGLTPEFESMVRLDGGGVRFADIAGLNAARDPVLYFQLYRETASGMIPSRELIAANDIVVASGIRPTMVRAGR